MSTRTPGNDLPVRRVDRILATMAMGLLILSIAAFAAIMIATAAGMEQADFATGIWPAVALVTYVGLPVAFVLFLIVIVMSLVRRARANRGR